MFDNENLQVMMHEKEISFIESYLRPEHTVLEYGSGGSTIHFSSQVKKYYSIEHNADWSVEIRPRLSDNVVYHIVDPERGPAHDIIGGPPSKIIFKNGREAVLRSGPVTMSWDGDDNTWAALGDRDHYAELKNYITYPAKFNTKFDIVLVDGRARPECARFVTQLIHQDSIVLIHDFWNRPHYECVFDIYDEVGSVRDTSQTIVALKLKDSE